MQTFAALCSQPAHRSFWRAGLAQRSGSLPTDEWLVEQANLRGFFGAFGRDAPTTPVDPTLTLEDIVCGLLQPHGPADGRLFKLVLRILQSGKVAPDRLAALARRERAEHLLAWLLERVPDPERTPEVVAIAQAIGTPRGYRPPAMDYDASRLVRRPFRMTEARWIRRPESS